MKETSFRRVATETLAAVVYDEAKRTEIDKWLRTQTGNGWTLYDLELSLGRINGGDFIYCDKDEIPGVFDSEEIAQNEGWVQVGT